MLQCLNKHDGRLSWGPIKSFLSYCILPLTITHEQPCLFDFSIFGSGGPSHRHSFISLKSFPSVTQRPTLVWTHTASRPLGGLFCSCPGRWSECWLWLHVHLRIMQHSRSLLCTPENVCYALLFSIEIWFRVVLWEETQLVMPFLISWIVIFFPEYEDGSLSSWVNRERFQGYLQIDGFTLYELGETGMVLSWQHWSFKKQQHHSNFNTK